jgi:uncharacterized protein YecE (DUF72 family)
MPILRIGTCSWKYESWKGLVYSNSAEINYLKEYSNRFKTVEVDQWFWSLFENTIALPKKEDIMAYKESVPKDFTFTIKIPNSLTLTHYPEKNKTKPLRKNPHFLSYDIYKDFVDLLKPLHKQIGAIMFQFEYLNKDKMSSLQSFENQFLSFYEKLESNALPIAIEIRNPNYLSSSYFSFLNELHIIPVFLEGYFMPPVNEVYDKYKDLIKDTVIIRLHGPDRSGIEKISGGNWDQVYINRDAELKRIIEMLSSLMSRDVNIYINVNNHFEGSAPLTIQKIEQLLQR